MASSSPSNDVIENPSGLDALGDAAERDRLTLAQQESISKHIQETQPLIGKIESPSVLSEEYKDNPEKGFLLGVEGLVKRYRGIRRIRGDGNCFYRAFLFAYLASIIQARSAAVEAKGGKEEEKGGNGSKEGGKEEGKEVDSKALKELTVRIKESRDWLLTVGYSDTAIDSFWEVFLEELEALPNKSMETLYEEFNEEAGVTSYMVWYLRLLTAGYLKLHKEEFAPFILDGLSVEEFCGREVEPVGKECEQIQIMALTRALEIGVRIEYLDGRHFRGQLEHIVLPEGLEPKVTLLYRPGHYDVIEG